MLGPKVACWRKGFEGYSGAPIFFGFLDLWIKSQRQPGAPSTSSSRQLAASSQLRIAKGQKKKENRPRITVKT